MSTDTKPSQSLQRHPHAADLIRRFVSTSQVLVTDSQLYLQWFNESLKRMQEMVFIFMGRDTPRCKKSLKGWMVLDQYLASLKGGPSRGPDFGGPSVSLEDALQAAYCFDPKHEEAFFLVPPEALTSVSDSLRMQVSRFMQSFLEDERAVRLVQFVREESFLDFSLGSVIEVDEREVGAQDVEAYFHWVVDNLKVDSTTDFVSLRPYLQGMNRAHVMQAVTYAAVTSRRQTGQRAVLPEHMAAYRASVGLPLVEETESHSS